MAENKEKDPSPQTVQQVVSALSDALDPADDQARPAIRRRIEQELATDAELDAFILDYFFATYRQFSRGMERIEKLNSLLARNAPNAILWALNLFLSDRSTIPSRFKRAKRSARRKIKRTYVYISALIGAVIEFAIGPLKYMWGKWLYAFSGSKLLAGAATSLTIVATGASTGYIVISYTDVVPVQTIEAINRVLGTGFQSPGMKRKLVAELTEQTDGGSAIQDLSHLDALAIIDGSADGLFDASNDLDVPDLAAPDLGTPGDLAAPVEIIRAFPRDRSPVAKVGSPRRARFQAASGNPDEWDSEETLKKFSDPMQMACTLLSNISDQSSTVVEFSATRLASNISRMLGTEEQDSLRADLQKLTKKRSSQDIIKWVEINILEEKDSERQECYGKLYKNWFRNLARIYAAAYIKIKSEKTFDKFQSDMDINLEDEASEYVTLCKKFAHIDKKMYLLSLTGEDGLVYACHSWIRRKVMDKSVSQSLRLLRKVIQNYDPEFWGRYGSELY